MPPPVEQLEHGSPEELRARPHAAPNHRHKLPRPKPLQVRVATRPSAARRVVELGARHRVRVALDQDLEELLLAAGERCEPVGAEWSASSVGREPKSGSAFRRFERPHFGAFRASTGQSKRSHSLAKKNGGEN